MIRQGLSLKSYARKIVRYFNRLNNLIRYAKYSRPGLWKTSNKVYSTSIYDSSHTVYQLKEFDPSPLRISFIYSLLSFVIRGRIYGDVIYISRTEGIKIFDLNNKVIYYNLNQNRNYKDVGGYRFFDFFSLPKNGKNPAGFEWQEYINGSILLKSKKSIQYKSITNIIERYSLYSKGHSIGNSKVQIKEAFDFMVSKASKKNKSTLEGYRENVISLATYYKSVHGHGDFNGANIIMSGGEIYVIDNSSFGVIVPSLYDIVNLGLNEVYEGRSRHIIEFIRNYIEDESNTNVLNRFFTCNVKRFSNLFDLLTIINISIRCHPHMSNTLNTKCYRNHIVNRRIDKFREMARA